MTARLSLSLVSVVGLAVCALRLQSLPLAGVAFGLMLAIVTAEFFDIPAEIARLVLRRQPVVSQIVEAQAHRELVSAAMDGACWHVPGAAAVGCGCRVALDEMAQNSRRFLRGERFNGGGE